MATMYNSFGDGVAAADPVQDGLDDQAWTHVRAILVAAHRGDASAMAAQLLAYDAAMSDDQHVAAGAYVLYILRFQVIFPLRHRPTLQDLAILAARIYPRYANLGRFSQVALEDTLRAAFLMPRDPVLTGAKLFISAAAAAGVLLNDPSKDLAAMRPRVARWAARDPEADQS